MNLINMPTYNLLYLLSALGIQSADRTLDYHFRNPDFILALIRNSNANMRSTMIAIRHQTWLLKSETMSLNNYLKGK